MSTIDFIKQYAPKISTDAENHVHETSDLSSYAANTNNQSHIAKLLSHWNVSIRTAAARNSNASKENLDKALNDFEHPVHWTVRAEAASNTNCNTEHLDKALSDINHYVRAAAAENPNCTKEHLDKALNDYGDNGHIVRAIARRNPRYKEYYPNGHE